MNMVARQPNTMARKNKISLELKSKRSDFLFRKFRSGRVCFSGIIGLRSCEPTRQAKGMWSPYATTAPIRLSSSELSRRRKRSGQRDGRSAAATRDAPPAANSNGSRSPVQSGPARYDDKAPSRKPRQPSLIDQALVSFGMRYKMPLSLLGRVRCQKDRRDPIEKPRSRSNPNWRRRSPLRRTGLGRSKRVRFQRVGNSVAKKAFEFCWRVLCPIGF